VKVVVHSTDTVTFVASKGMGERKRHGGEGPAFCLLPSAGG
jgi:hypothetical protein